MLVERKSSDLVLVLICVASLIIHLKDDLFQLLFSAPHQLRGTLPLSELKENRPKTWCHIMSTNINLMLHICSEVGLLRH